MQSLVRVTGVGYNARTPHIKYTPRGVPWCDLGVAVTEKIQKDGEWVDGITTWFTVVCYDRNAYIATQTINKGDRVFFTGEMRRKDWKDDNGEPKVTLEVKAEHIGLAPIGHVPDQITVSDQQMYRKPPMGRQRR
jgi:single-strand DNA-binding protein